MVSTNGTSPRRQALGRYRQHLGGAAGSSPSSDLLHSERCRQLVTKLAQVLDVGREDRRVMPGGDDGEMGNDDIGS